MMAVRVTTLAALSASCGLLWSCTAPANGAIDSTEAAPSRTSAPAKPSAASVPNLCSPSEQVLYSCRLEDKQITSMCLGDGRLSYRESATTRADRVQFQLSSKPDWSNIHLGDVRGGGGGHQTHVRFTAPDGDNYIVLEGALGQYHDAPGGPWSGVTIVGEDGQEDGRRCQSGAIITADWYRVISQSAPKDSKPAREEEGSKFDGWY